MFSQRIATSIDYNRGLHPPIRWVHVTWAAAWPVVDALFGWMRHPLARNWAPLVLFTAFAVLILLPQDHAVSHAAQAWLDWIGNDFKREMVALQQYGQGLFIVLIALVIFLLDRARAARLLDWGTGALIALVATNLATVLAGRPRPDFEDPWAFVGPLGAYAFEKTNGAARIESVWTSNYELASMPSRHAAFAVLASVFLATLYPRIRWVVFVVAVLVCIGRVATGAHYPSDTVVGAALGLLIARYAVGREWGQQMWNALVAGAEARRKPKAA